MYYSSRSSNYVAIYGQVANTGVHHSRNSTDIQRVDPQS